MAYFLALLALLLGLVGLLILLSSRVNKLWQIEQAVLVQAKPAELFELLQTWRAWPNWSVWNAEVEPELELSYRDADTGVGAVQIWQGKLNAEAEILAIEPERLMDYSLNLDQGRVCLQGTIALSASNDFQTQVAWRLSVKSLGKGNGLFVGFKLYALRLYFEAGMRQSLQNLAALFSGSNELDEAQGAEEDNPILP